MARPIEGFRLSPQQKHLWLVQKSEVTLDDVGIQGNFLYWTQCLFRIDGNLDAKILNLAWQTIINRHEILRTTFQQLPGMTIPIQVISDSTAVIDNEHDLSDLKRKAQDNKIEALLEAARRQPVNFDQGPLIKVSLVRLSPKKHALLISLPSLCADRVSLKNLIEELSSAYQACSAGEILSTEPMQYVDFTTWQNELLESEDTEAERAYWPKHKASGALNLTIPFENSCSQEEAFNPNSLTTQIDPKLAAGIKTLAQKYDTSTSDFLMAGWQVLLYRLSGRARFTIGKSYDGRPYEELEAAIGLFEKYLPLHCHFEEDTQFSEILQQVNQLTDEAYEYQEYFNPEEFVEETENTSNSAFLPFCFDFVEQTIKYSAANISFSIDKLYSCIDRFKIKLLCVQGHDSIITTFHYDSNLFSEDGIKYLAGQFQTLLENAINNPQAKIQELEFLSDTERQQLLIEFNNTRVDYPKDKCLHHLFEEQVERTPENIAVVFEDQQLTYAELNARANQLAHYLRKKGIQADKPVAICVERSPEMMVGLLGILKSGAAYVPLDLTYPTDRLTFMLRDAQTSVVLTKKSVIEQNKFTVENRQLTAVTLDTDWQAIARESEENPANGAKPDNLAYVIYTSGSTGKPKGTMVTHKGLVNYLSWCTQAYAVANGHGSLVHSPIGFDLTVTSLFAPLIVGKSVVLLSESQGPEALSTVLRNGGNLSIVKITPAHLEILSQLLPAEAVAGSTKTLIIGGEALWGENLSFWLNHAPDTRLINEYGPTEAAVGCCVYEVPAKASLSGAVPIGRPIQNTQLYLLDPYLKPVPTGVAGELYIGGDGVARGYLNRPDLTAERFIPNPFSEEGGARLYKTGDLTRFLPEGVIEFLGRIDQQVKIRGFRVELGEIEMVLSQHPAVREAIVLSREVGDHKILRSNRLVAYVVPEQEEAGVSPPTVVDLRNFIEQKLPEYMVPSAFVMLSALPLTPNGKVDLQSLPEPDAARPDLGIFIAPGTPEEEILGGIWSKVLGVERVGVDDNYFALGGDSIRAIQVVAQAQERGLSFTVDHLFKYPTILELARSLKTAGFAAAAVPKSQPFSLISPEDRMNLPDDVEDAYPMTMLQAGMIFHREYSPESAVYHDIFSIHLKAPFDLEVLQTVLKQLLGRHPALRTAFDLSNYSEPLQLVYQTCDMPFQIEDMRDQSLEQQEDAIRNWIEAEKTRGFDSTRCPLIRFQVHRRTEETFQFTWSFHHGIIDGWSDATMIAELFHHYFSILNGEPIHIDASNSCFRDYVALERQALASEECKRYWEQKLSDSTLMRLPCLMSSEQDDQSFPPPRQIVKLEVPISDQISDGLKSLALSTAVPVKSVLLAAHMRVMSLLSGQSDVITCVVSNGRLENLDGERVLGLFLNSLPFRLKLQGGAWTDLISHTFQAEQELLPYRRYPMAELKKSRGGQPLSETLFYFTHYHIYQGLQKWNAELLGTIYHEESSFPLVANFRIDPFTSHLHLDLDYDCTQFSNNQMEEFAGYYTKVFTAMVNQPFERYETRCLLSTPEQHQLLVEWNSTRNDFPLKKCIHHLIEAQVERTPGEIAVIFEDQHLTYRQLNSRANQIARHLQKLGVGPEVRVGICVERNIKMLMGLLGILKAGGVYVPLDPAYPAERIAFMIEDSDMSVMLTQQRFVFQLTIDNQQLPTVCLDTDWQAITQEREESPATEVKPDNLAYVIYTSGSTGSPKGVAIAHNNTVALLYWAEQVFSEAHRARVLASTSLSFDLSVFELFVPLSWGGAVILAKNVLQLPTLPQAEDITLINTVPSLMAELLKHSNLPASVLTVNLAGEPLQTRLVEQIYQQETVEQVFDLYGPSETTTYSTFSLRRSNGHATIGRPVSNTQIFLLDAFMQQVPVGVQGELYIGGSGLARGYLNRPELTAEKFIPNPFSDNPGARLYKTGDLARYLSDGQIEYIGRIDHQAKIRGFRIELGEIEVILSQHHAVEEAVVLVREDLESDKRLVAYLVSNSELNPGRRVGQSEISRREAKLHQVLRQYLQEKLPNYMVPQAFVFLKELPRLHNGKVNRQALPAPEGIPLQLNYEPPQNEVERAIAQIWQEVLHVDKVGIDNNFFDLGGHSFSLIQVQSKLRQIFKQDLSIMELFKFPTVNLLAKYFNQGKSEQTDFQKIHDLAKKQKEAMSRQKQLMREFKKNDIHLD